MLLRTSANVVFFWKNGQLISDNFVSREQRALSPLAEPLLRWFSSWKDLDSLKQLDAQASEKLRSMTLLLLSAGVLIEKDSAGHELEEELALWDGWGQAAKYFRFSGRAMAETRFLDAADDAERLKEKAKVTPPPPIYKEYENVAQIPLGVPEHRGVGVADEGGGDFAKVLLGRRTNRALDPGQQVTLEQLSTILYLAFGATRVVDTKGTGQVIQKTSPSGGARHSIEVYPCILNVDGVPPGMYHYSVKNHRLETITGGDLRSRIPFMCGDQLYTDKSGVVFFYAAVIERQMWKYETARAYRGILMDLGHLSQTFYLVATWLGLGAFFTAAVRDEAVEESLQLDWTKEMVLGVSGLGTLASGARAEQERAFAGVGPPIH